jgi:hypothetical protein
MEAYQQSRKTIDKVINPTLQVNRAILGRHNSKTIGQHPVSHPRTRVHSVAKLLLCSIIRTPKRWISKDSSNIYIQSILFPVKQASIVKYRESRRKWCELNHHNIAVWSRITSLIICHINRACVMYGLLGPKKWSSPDQPRADVLFMHGAVHVSLG